jgi:hypothetical protein
MLGCKSNQDISKFDYDDISPELKILVENLIKTDYIGTEKIGRSPELSPAYANREAIFSLAGQEELLALIDHPEGEVAATAFEGLAKMEYADLKTELLNLSKGDRALNFIKGDVIFTMPALEYAYINVLGIGFDEENSENHPLETDLTKDEKAFIENRIKAIKQTL